MFRYFFLGGYYKGTVPANKSVGILILKFVCPITLHLMMQPIIHDPILRLQYIISHQEQFEQLFIPVLLQWMKLIAELGIELSLIVSMAYWNDELWLTMCFTALMVIKALTNHTSQLSIIH